MGNHEEAITNRPVDKDSIISALKDKEPAAVNIFFFVPGIPVPKGSAKAFVVKNKKTGKHRAIVVQDNKEKQKPWASMIASCAQDHFNRIHHGPIRLSLDFAMPRPKNHYGSGKNAHILKPNAPTWHISKPDLDKLIRCVKDALTGVVWKDDSQVCAMGGPRKIYGDRPGVRIQVESL
jgi:crossover junction endodeoxyribonuclease RusA